MARRGYSSEFRRRVLDLIDGGRRVAGIAINLGISEQTIYTWRRQARIDAGIEVGLSTFERGELAAAESPPGTHATRPTVISSSAFSAFQGRLLHSSA